MQNLSLNDDDEEDIQDPTHPVFSLFFPFVFLYILRLFNVCIE